RDRADIVEVVKDEVELRQAGVSLKGLCPFHNEKTPSFTVSAARSTYHCFGCDAHGDAIKFVQQTRNLGFVETLRYLGERFGVEIPEVEMTSAEAAADKDKRERRQWLLRANDMATLLFARALHAPAGQEGRDYLRRRAIGPEIVQSFRLGYADEQWDSLAQELARNGVPPGIVVEAGLARERQGGGQYDFFRRRLVTPVSDHLGRVVAFSARALAEEDEARAKYVNSPESAVFKKGRTLFGLEQARAAIRQKGHAVLVEGNFDVLSLHQAGCDQAVASLGTALTAGQVALLHRQTQEVVLLYDGDAAGRKSALKAAPIFADEGLEFRVAQLPRGVDPDDFVRQRGAEALTELLDQAPPGVQWAIRAIVPERSAPPDKKERAVEAVGRLVGRLTSRIARTEYRALTADLLGVDERAISRHFEGAAPVTPTLRPRRSDKARDLAGPCVLAILAEDLELAREQAPDRWDSLLDGRPMRRAVVALLNAARSGAGDPVGEGLAALGEDERVAASRVLHDPPALPEGTPREALASIEAQLVANRGKKRVSPVRGVVDNADLKRHT
ncbi:MAG: DNA primase, partial [Planctomycetota bacterium]|nr:DNA primase [Planctomycetota bacterium]